MRRTELSKAAVSAGLALVEWDTLIQEQRRRHRRWMVVFIAVGAGAGLFVALVLR